MNTPTFSPDDYRRLTLALAKALETYPPELVARAAEAVKVSLYKQPGELPFREPAPSTGPFSKLFPSVEGWIAAVREGVPSAFEAALDVLSEVDPEPTAPLARAAMDLPLWREAKGRAARALSRSATKESFVRLLDGLREAPTVAFLLTQSPYRDGGPLVVERLRESPVWRYEPVILPTEDTWSAMGESAREAAQEAIDAASSAHKGPDVETAQDLLRYLGAKRCSEAGPMAAKLYAEHPSRKIRLAAGHALFGLGDEESLGLLISLAGHHDEWRPWFAVKARIGRAPERAVESLGGEALSGEGARATLDRAFGILENEAADRAKEGALASAWLFQDPGWLPLVARWVKDKSVGFRAEVLLDRFPKDQIEQALSAAKAKAGAPGKKAAPKKDDAKKAGAKKAGATAKTTETDAKSLFLAGDGAGAWQKLVALGPAVRDPAHLAQAREIASLTMRRAREDLERIVERLGKAGYRFASPGNVLSPPPADIGARLDELESIIGTLPISLRAAIEHIGAVNLAGDHPAWPKSAHARLRPVAGERDLWLTDPLVIVPIGAMLDDTEGWGGHRPFSLALSGDALTKAGMSGSTYTVETPCEAADATIAGEVGSRTFVEHLRLALRYGGFAGFERIADRPQALLDALVAGSAPI